MSRPLRIEYPNAVYHVTSRGNERKRIVRDNEDRRKFIQVLKDMIEQYQVLCHAWVLMDNHYHLLLETPQANLSRAIRHLNGVYTQAFNRRHYRVGHLFQGRFKSIIVEKESYLMELCRYLVLNPVRAGRVKHPRSWAWSSYPETAGEKPPSSWLSIEWLLLNFSSRRKIGQKAYREFVAEGIRDPQRPWSDLRSQIYLGSEVFLERIQKRVKSVNDTEIPVNQRQPVTPEIEKLLHCVAGSYGCSVRDLLRSTRRPKESRQVALYLMRRIAGLHLKVIAKRFGMGYTGVSRRVSDFARRLEEEPGLRKRVDALLAK